jgi:hypothetical protein
VLAGLLGIDVAEAYARHGAVSGGHSIGGPEMRRALESERRTGALDRILVEVPLWPHAQPGWTMAWGLTSWWQQDPWWQYVATAIDAGCYGVAQVRFDATGPLSDGTDHWVLFAGYREGERSTSACRELLVSCPARGPAGRWARVDTFLRDEGGFGVMFARPCPVAGCPVAR